MYTKNTSYMKSQSGLESIDMQKWNEMKRIMFKMYRIHVYGRIDTIK